VGKVAVAIHGFTNPSLQIFQAISILWELALELRICHVLTAMFCDFCKFLGMFMDRSNSPCMQYFDSELLVETFSVLLCVLMQYFASNMQFFKPIVI